MAEDLQNDIISRHLKLAETFLESAGILLEAGDFRSAVGRLYYSMYHASIAALTSKGFSPKTHKGTITLFGEEFVKKGLISADLGRYLADAFDLRQEGDYEIYASFDADIVKDMAKKANDFLSAIKRFLG